MILTEKEIKMLWRVIELRDSISENPPKSHVPGIKIQSHGVCVGVDLLAKFLLQEYKTTEDIVKKQNEGC